MKLELTLKCELPRIFPSFPFWNHTRGWRAVAEAPLWACLLVWGLIKVSSGFQKTVKSASPAHGLRAQEDWVTGFTLSSWSLSRMYPLWIGHPVPLCWSLYHVTWAQPLPTAHCSSAGRERSPRSLQAGGMELRGRLWRSLLSSAPGAGQ